LAQAARLNQLILTARALAFVRGRDYALPQDVLDMPLMSCVIVWC